jgi:hypothetical protein
MSQGTPTTKSDECVGRAATVPEHKGLADLFAERNLWQLYKQSQAFYHNPFNRVVSIAAGTLIVGFAVVHFARLGTTSTNRVDFPALFSTWANDGVTYGTTILGFLLAGFTVLFAVLRPHTVIALRQITRPGEHLYELKLIFVAFIDVFVHYTTFLFWCITYLVAGGKDGPFDFIGRFLSAMAPLLPVAITHVVFVAWGMWFLVLVLKLKSFIFNLYQTLLLGMADSQGIEPG